MNQQEFGIFKPYKPHIVWHPTQNCWHVENYNFAKLEKARLMRDCAQAWCYLHNYMRKLTVEHGEGYLEVLNSPERVKLTKLSQEYQTLRTKIEESEYGH